MTANIDATRHCDVVRCCSVKQVSMDTTDIPRPFSFRRQPLARQEPPALGQSCRVPWTEAAPELQPLDMYRGATNTSNNSDASAASCARYVPV